MNRELRKPKMPNPQLTDAQLDAALGAEHDGILPSSGFADAVMFAVQADATAPAPIPFPWKRAIPAMIAAAGALVLLVAWFVKDVSGHATASAGTTLWGSRHLDVAVLLHQAANPDALWVAISLVIPLVCLLVMRRVLFGR
jgi:HAMP domain-containing protein